ncbi:MAG TPA: lipase maturation factor family protein [Polyangiales bacterium]|nr:lipase maturation factor family protein [Polyangiales bacterium]
MTEGHSSDDDREVLRALRSDFWSPDAPRYWLTRFVFLRALGLVYFVAYAVLWNQMLPLFGSHGLTPAAPFVARMREEAAFWQLPTLFYWDVSDAVLHAGAGVGLALSFALLCGAEHAAILAVLWVLYLSFVHVGQDWYGYGWEILLLEAGFLACFLGPVRSVLPLRAASPPALPVIWLLRWLIFRVMFGAGMIKIRGDACWRDLTCLAYHYETQPNPHPLSWVLHQAPLWFHQVGVAFNHLVELIVPFFVFGPARVRRVAGLLVVVFQTILILSGNLSFLNWLTLAVALACFDDDWFARVLPRALVARAEALETHKQPIGRPQRWIVSALCVFVLIASYAPVANMLSPRQRMNTSFEPLHLVNSYGAFGSVGKTRDEVILEGTSDAQIGPNTRWLAYEFKCKPGDVKRRPCLITPYHLRLDWQMWFAALSEFEQEPWILHLIYKLLHNDEGTLSLIANRPFPGAPPRFIRAERYRYRFTRFGEPGWWSRKRLGVYLPPLSRTDPNLREFLENQGWIPHSKLP